MDAATESANDLIWLSDALLSPFGQDIEFDGRVVRCLVLSGFFVASYSEEPELTIYSISQLDDAQIICHLFEAARQKGSGSIDVRFHRDGPWQKTFRKLGTEMIDLGHLR
jgi:hypothetical protein